MLLPDGQKNQIESQYKTRVSELEKELSAAQQMIAIQQQILKSNFANTTLAQPPADTASAEETPLPPLKPLSNLVTNGRPPVKLPDFGPPIGNIANTVMSAAVQGREDSFPIATSVSNDDRRPEKKTRSLGPAIITIAILAVAGSAAVVMRLINPPLTLPSHISVPAATGMAVHPKSVPAPIAKNRPSLSKGTVSRRMETNKDAQSGPSLLPNHMSSAVPALVHHTTAAASPHRSIVVAHDAVHVSYTRPAAYTKPIGDRRAPKAVRRPFLSAPVTAVRRNEATTHPLKFHKRPRQTHPNIDETDQHDPPGWDEHADRWIDNLP